MILTPNPLAEIFQASHQPVKDRSAMTTADRSVRPMVQYQEDPLGFFTKILLVPEHTLRWKLNPGFLDHNWDGTEEPILAILNALANWEDVAVEAANGTQKSFTAAGIKLWFLACWENARVYSFAPKEDQLRQFMWSEVRKMWPAFKIHFPSASLTDLCIRIRGGTDDTWSAHGYPVAVRAGEEVSTHAQGMHARDMLLIYEETPGISKSTIAAGENTCTSPHNLRLYLGNPESQLDTLHVASKQPGVHPIRLSALDHPNVVANDSNIVPGAVSLDSITRRKVLYGEDHRLYRARVRGMSPGESPEALIKLEWVEAAQRRWVDKESREILMKVGFGRPSLGLDVSNSEQGDKACKAFGVGAVCISVKEEQCTDSNDYGFRASLEMDEKGINDDNVGVDNIGVGAGCVNELRHRGKWVRAINSGSPVEGDEKNPLADNKYRNVRAQIGWQLREDLRLGLIALPPDDPTDENPLSKELTTPEWFTKNGKIQIQAKEKIIELLGRSPNKYDAVVYWNWVRPRDPVTSSTKKAGAPTTRERVHREIEQLRKADIQTVKAKSTFSVLRQ